MNHTLFPEKDHLSDWARWDNKVTKGDRVDSKAANFFNFLINVENYKYVLLYLICVMEQ